MPQKKVALSVIGYYWGAGGYVDKRTPVYRVIKKHETCTPIRD